MLVRRIARVGGTSLLASVVVFACNAEVAGTNPRAVAAAGASAGGGTGVIAYGGAAGAAGGSAGRAGANLGGGAAGSTAAGAAGEASGPGGGAAAGGGAGAGGAAAAGGGAGAGGAGGGGGAAGSSNGASAAQCFATLTPNGWADYDQFGPTVDMQCAGTHQQHITGIEKVVYLGDSITAGTPPTPPWQFFRNRLSARLMTKFGPLEDIDCSRWGAETVDLMDGGKQIAKCFPTGVEPKRTLIVLTMGGNDLSNVATANLPLDQSLARADTFAQTLRTSLMWLKDPAHFPKGSYVVFGDVYEYTDGTGKLSACSASALGGLSSDWPEGRPVITHLNEQYVKAAVATQTDMVFMYEAFCGHGYLHDDPMAPCYRGPNTDMWFDLSCVHPNPTGHQHLADLFMKTIGE